MNVAELDAALNEMLVQGKVLEAFERFYDDDVVMVENDERFAGKEANRQRQAEFFASISEHTVEIVASAVAGDVSFCEQTIAAQLEDGRSVRLGEVAVRRWRDGRIVEERFYYKPR